MPKLLRNIFAANSFLFRISYSRLIRSWVTGGATIELELALAEGAGLN